MSDLLRQNEKRRREAMDVWDNDQADDDQKMIEIRKKAMRAALLEDE